MMHDNVMQGSGWMMGGMMIVMLLIVVFLIAGIVYFVKGTQAHSRNAAGVDRGANHDHD